MSGGGGGDVDAARQASHLGRPKPLEKVTRVRLLHQSERNRLAIADRRGVSPFEDRVCRRIQRCGGDGVVGRNCGGGGVGGKCGAE